VSEGIKQRIHLLPDGLANRIAAGEVVERPASVVKELVENALDAGATRILVEVEGAGKIRIRVNDDGQGMSREDALLAIQRHATSKIATEEDLFSISTLGFRGEALPSIASVSLFTLTTCNGEGAGTRLVIEGGELKRTEEVGYPRGTDIEVNRLFYNTPARQKFMKADSTELAAITEIMNKLALARSDVRFRYLHNGRELLNLTPTDDLHERAAGIFGRQSYPKLFPLSGTQGDWSITGMVSAPDHTRNTSNHLHLFLNGRAIRDRGLQFAVIRAFGTMLETKRFPIGVILLQMPVTDVDVNVHPAKHEVRFNDSRRLYSFVSDTVREALARSPWLSAGAGPAHLSENTDIPVRVGAALAEYERRRNRQAVFNIDGGWAPARPAQPGAPWRAPISGHEPKSDDIPLVVGPIASLPTEGQREGGFSSFTVLAQLHNTFILVSTPSGLGIIDQHAAHERVTYERLRKSYRDKAVEQQMMLFPIRVDLDAERVAALEQFGEQIARMGFEVEPFGGDSVQIRGVPQVLAAADPAEMLMDLLDEMSDIEGSGVVDDSVDLCLATLACHASVRANDPLNYEQMAALLRHMDTIDFAANCPHGRPVFVEITHTELEKRFARIK
jgi:DNA mismatch repair protein MutL